MVTFLSSRSSVDPDKLSLTLKGLLSLLAPALIALLAHYGYPLGREDLDAALTLVLTITSSAVTLYGLYRRITTINKATMSDETQTPVEPTVEPVVEPTTEAPSVE